MISRDQINEFSRRLGIDEFTVIREYLQVVFLSVLYSMPGSNKIYFKGGTAIRLLLKSGRFSEDLDFTSELDVRALEPLVQEAVKKMLFVVSDMILKRTDENKVAYTAMLSYQPVGMKYPLNLHLDFSLREKPLTSQDTVLESDFPVLPLPVVRHMDASELLAEKIRAFLYRLKGRDVYDMWFLLQKGIALDWEMVNRKLALYAMTTSFKDLLVRVGQFEDKQLKNDLAKFLPINDRGFIDHLKELTSAQLISRQHFSIIRSENIEYTKIPGGSFSGSDTLMYDLKMTKIVAITRQDENMLVVNLIDKDNHERTGFMRARSRNGVRELDIIARHVRILEGKSYDELLNYQFTG